MITARFLIRCLLGVCLGIIGVAGGLMYYANSVGEKSDQNTEQIIRESQLKWCGIVTLFDDTYKENPPETSTGRQLASEMSKLRVEFGC